MILQKLSIVNYKNIGQAELLFSPKLNCFFGKNGMGKTNLLDAVYYLSFCKSHSGLPDTQVILHESDFFMLQGFYDANGKEEEVHCAMKRRQKKQFKRNKKEYERLSDHIGFIPLVMVSPEDSVLIQGGSEERRKFLDVVISQYDKFYLSSLVTYNRALQQRNSLLKEEAKLDESLLAILEETMSAMAVVIYQARRRFIDEFLPVFNRYYLSISGGQEEVSVEYTSHLAQGELLPLLREVRVRDLAVGYTTRGIHKDDMEFLLGDYAVKRIGSQGQNKTFLIALKLAQFDFLKRKGGVTPLLLLDDIFDKLDAGRVERIVALVAGEDFGQIFITDTNRKYLDAILQAVGSDHHIYRVEDGGIELLD